MATEASQIWHDCFSNWPAEISRQGVLVTSFGEQIAFENFAISPRMLLVERRAPDTVGARTVIVAFEQIAALKIIDVAKAKAYQSMGFVPPPAKGKA